MAWENDYCKALEAAGATVHALQEFGSWQGDWWAKVTLSDGRTGWINGSYGSCSVCDAFEAEFGWDAENKPDYADRLAKFGAGYLDDIMDQDAAEKKAAEHISWDSDAEKMLKFIKENSCLDAR